MQAIVPSQLSDGFSTLERGANSGRIPSLLKRNQVSFAVNTIFRGGYAQQRPGFIKRLLQHLDFYHPESEFVDGRFQGIHAFTPPGGNPLLVLSISGRIYSIDILNDFNVTDVTPPDGPNSSVRPQAWFASAADWCLIQDGESRCIIFNGVSSRRAADDEVPTGTAMAYGMGRVWVARGKEFLAGDIFGGSSGTATYQYRDAILKFTENTYLNEGGSFSLPLDAGEITAVKFTAQLDTALGQGELLVGTASAIFSVHVPVDRTQWKNLTTPIQRIALLGYGPATQNSFEKVNSDFFFRSLDGVRSFVLAQRQFYSYGNVPLSREVSRVLEKDELRLLKFSSAVLFDQRLLMTASPHQVSGKGVYHRGMVVLDFDPLSSMDDKTPPAWDCLWTGINVLQLVKITVRDEERCFAVVLSACDTIELWEITRNDRFDNGNRRVEWLLEMPSYTWDSPFEQKRLMGGDMWVDRVTGAVDFNVDFRSDQYPGWLDWHNWSECANFQDCDYGTYGVCRTIPQFAEQYRPRMRLPQPADICDETFPKFHRNGYEFQPRITITGFARIRQMRLHAQLQPEIVMACQPAGVCKTLSVCDADPYTYVSDEPVCPYVPPPPPPEPAPSDCPDCPDPGDCAGWEGDPFVGDTFAARFSNDGAASNYLGMPADVTLGHLFLPESTPMTFGCFIKWNTVSAFTGIMARWQGGGNHQFLLAYRLAGAQFEFYIESPASVDGTLVVPFAVTTGVWYFVCAAFDPAIGKMRLWINGVQSNMNWGNGMKGAGNLDGMIIGNYGETGSLFNGFIESAFLYRGLVFNDARALAMYNSGIGVRYSRLVHKGLPVPTVWLEFEDGANPGKNSNGSPLYDFATSINAAGPVTLDIGLPLS